jgi:hypothetical protein
MKKENLLNQERESNRKSPCTKCIEKGLSKDKEEETKR